jgi:hypothetical protein
VEWPLNTSGKLRTADRSSPFAIPLVSDEVPSIILPGFCEVTRVRNPRPLPLGVLTAGALPQRVRKTEYNSEPVLKRLTLPRLLTVLLDGESHCTRAFVADLYGLVCYDWKHAGTDVAELDCRRGRGLAN